MGCGVGKLTWPRAVMGVWGGETCLTSNGVGGGVWGGETYLTGDGGCMAGLSLAEEILESSLRPPLLRKSQLLVLE